MISNNLLDPAKLVSSSSDAMLDLGMQKALELFHSAADRVPAYAKFLAAHHIDSRTVKTISDFEKVPAITKENYLRKYPLHELLWDGSLHGADIISRSSGSSGQPFYWPSNAQQRDEVGVFYDLVFSSMFGMREKKTLVIIAYGMGSWVAGTTTLLSTADFMKEYDCTIVTPGYNKQEVIEICRDIGSQYEQIVICAYPPLVKEIIDYGRELGIKWSKLKPKFIFGAEAFSEELRDYMLNVAGSKQPLLDTMNTIGSADAMVIGHETPLSIALRRNLVKSDSLRNEVLGPSRLPTVAQYYPWQKYLEVVDGELYLTSNGAMPLVRYNIKDSAKVYSYSEMNAIMSRNGHMGVSDVLPVSMRLNYDWKLPFVLLYGKSTNAVKFFGAMIYPENIKAFLELPDLVTYFTGKFRMNVYTDAALNQNLSLVIELAPGINRAQIPSTWKLKSLFSEEVAQHNTEYRAVLGGVQRKAMPVIQLVPFGRFDLINQNKHKYVD